MFYSTKLMNFWHKNLHFVHNPSKLFKKGAVPPPQYVLIQDFHDSHANIHQVIIILTMA